MSEIKELTNLEATHVSYVRKGANKKEFFLMKSDSEEPSFEKEFNIFINKADDEKKLVYGVVYEPDAVDTQNEFAKADTIEKAAHKFLADCRNVDLQHNFQPGSGTVVESYVAPADFKIGSQDVKKGSWVLVTKAADEIWEDVKKGVITGYSMAGKATKTALTNAGKMKKEAFDESAEDVKGFFDVMKSFFTGGKIQKADNAGQVRSFAQRMVVNDVTENMWRVNDALRATMNDILSSPDIKDKKTALEKAIEEFAAYMKKRVSTIDDSAVKKSDINYFADEGIEKSDQKDEGDDDEVKKEDLQELMKAVVSEAIKPINEKLALIEKQDVSSGSGADSDVNTQSEVTKDDMLAVIKAALDDSLKPINERIIAIEKTRGISRQEQDDQNRDNVKKSVFAGLNI